MPKTETTEEWYWSSCEDGSFNGPHATKNEAIDDAVYGNAVFEDEDTDVIFLLNGHSYPNPDYDPEYPTDEENAPENLSGKNIEFTKTEALEWCLKEIEELRAKLRKATA